MLIPILSDQHIHNWREFSTLQPDGVPSRLADSLRPLPKLRAFMKARGFAFALHNGDLFHKRNVIQTQTFNLAFKEIEKFDEEGLNLLMVPGNHDQTTKDGKLHSLEPMKAITPVFDKPTLMKLTADTHLFFLPFLDDTAEVKSILSKVVRLKSATRFILAGHLGVSGAKAGPYEFQPLEQISASDFPSCFDAVLLGHYHTRQVLQKAGNGKPLVMYVGAPMQHSREDSGDKRGILIFDTDTLGYSFLPTKLPEFVTVMASGLAIHLREIDNNFVTVIADEDLNDTTKAMLDSRTRGWALQAMPKVQTASTQRMAVAPTMGHEQILDEYLAANPDPDLDSAELKQAGLDLLKEEA